MAPSVTNSDATNTTTIVQFNSVTQLLIKLAGSHNFSLWKAQVSMLIRGHNLYGHLDGTIHAPAETTTTNNLTISNPDYPLQPQPKHKGLELFSYLNLKDRTLPYSRTLCRALPCPHFLVWDSLHTAYANKSQTRIFSLRDRLACLTKESQLVTDYLNQVRSLCEELATAGAPVTNVELIVKTLTGLGPEYHEISVAIRARDTLISCVELFEKLSDHELFLKHNAPPQSTPITAVVAQKSSSQTWTNAINNNRHSNNYQQHSQSGRNRRTNSQEVSLVCQLCDRPGHSTRVCRSQSHNHFQARANFVGQQMQQSSPWIVDSGASHHVASDAHGLNNVADYNGPEEIAMRNGSEYGGAISSRAE
ncbi:hypothetical protein KY290_033675 [Solanum tuberosum]|uniref:Retrotransposon Copia-like N-terminal domain-containing protein n=1 Tax=Solanum tuberosum TaxID=4113 RepID=A0ABQ7U108_SOLTU|nr:hypothetical protein KY290_033675 [Solanum tuberosum]